LSTSPLVPVVHAAAAPTVRLGATNRFGPRWLNYLKSWFGPPTSRRLAYAALQIGAIRHWEKEASKMTDAEILQRGARLRGRGRGGESLTKMLPEVFGLVCVASWRAVRLRPFDVQLAAGVVLHHGALAEVATGEGKTLIATMPAALNALEGKGVHVTTVNDYLAHRDGEWTAQIYRALGISVGILQQKMADDARKEAYKADITYGTASEFGFDFLRDRLKQKSGSNQVVPFWAAWTAKGPSGQQQDPKVQREHHFALVDEADNIFVDEARTPLIIAMPSRSATEPEQVVYHWANGLALQMKRNQHFFMDDKKQKIEMTDAGRHLVRYSNPPVGPHSHAMDKLHEHVERALQANYKFRLDQQYMVEDGKVVIIDESTGRRMPDRHWREGLHQAVEAKEKVQVTLASDHAAQITYQSYFRLYKKLAGMTGTAAQNWRELRRVYKLRVVIVPTNMPCVREVWRDQIFPNDETKYEAVAKEIQRLQKLGRPVLIGTRSVEKSELISRKLTAAGIEHQVLNAKPGHNEREADIVAQAGRSGTVTIATNMAGRGTDILLGGNPETIAWALLKDKYVHRDKVDPEVWNRTVEEVEARENILEDRRKVIQNGGLHVLATERNEALRIDRQLIGRAARQGDPGSCQFFMSLEDDLLEGLGPDKQERIQKIGKAGGAGSWSGYKPTFTKAQGRLEKRHYRQRLDLMMYEKQRQEILKDLGADPYVD
jgi:preprotein translocase subunit SecA